jgi:multimeric flavodoxin WrbA
MTGDIISLVSRLRFLNPRGGFRTPGVCDAWNRFIDDERMDATYLTMISDIIPSMSDTLLHNGSIFDAHSYYAEIEEWAKNNPGTPAVIENTMAKAMQALTYNMTVTLDIDFKRRVPNGGLSWIFVRTATKMLDGGRMDVEVTICNQDMELLCTAQQLFLVLEAGRKFRDGKNKSLL